MRQKQEEYAAHIKTVLNLIQTLNDHKAKLTTKVETLTMEISTKEQEMEHWSREIKQLRQTIDSQELSQEDVRRMEREKARIKEQIFIQGGVLEGKTAALKKVREKWCAIHKLLEQKVAELDAQARQLLEIVRHARDKRFEVNLDRYQAVDKDRIPLEVDVNDCQGKVENPVLITPCNNELERAEAEHLQQERLVSQAEATREEAKHLEGERLATEAPSEAEATREAPEALQQLADREMIWLLARGLGALFYVCYTIVFPGTSESYDNSVLTFLSTCFICWL